MLRIVALLAIVMPVSAWSAQDPVQRSLDFLIEVHRLEARRGEALQACIAAAPQAAEHHAHELLGKFCLVRLGAPRVQALFLGEQIAQRLEARGEPEVAAVVDRLVAGLAAR